MVLYVKFWWKNTYIKMLKLALCLVVHCNSFWNDQKKNLWQIWMLVYWGRVLSSREKTTWFPTFKLSSFPLQQYSAFLKRWIRLEIRLRCLKIGGARPSWRLKKLMCHIEFFELAISCAPWCVCKKLIWHLKNCDWFLKTGLSRQDGS